MSDVEKERLEFHVFGVNRTQIAHLCKRQVLDSCFQIYGRVPRNEVIRVLRDMDFSLLLRPADERYAKAGFPTKAVEAMSNGVVMMCNISSDLDLYLKDAANAIIVQDATPEALAEAVRRALALSREDIHHLKHAAKKMAIEKFDYQKYVDTMQHFIQE